jgi:hypothetical protein
MTTKYVLAANELIARVRAQARKWADEEEFGTATKAHATEVITEFVLNQYGYTHFPEKATYGKDLDYDD